jgi:hypothetical protein
MTSKQEERVRKISKNGIRLMREFGGNVPDEIKQLTIKACQLRAALNRASKKGEKQND